MEQTKWKSVVNKMPENKGNGFSKKVPVMYIGKNGDYALTFGVYYHSLGDWINESAKVIPDVTHWYDLPTFNIED